MEVIVKLSREMAKIMERKLWVARDQSRKRKMVKMNQKEGALKDKKKFFPLHSTVLWIVFLKTSDSDVTILFFPGGYLSVITVSVHFPTSVSSFHCKRHLLTNNTHWLNSNELSFFFDAIVKKRMTQQGCRLYSYIYFQKSEARPSRMRSIWNWSRRMMKNQC